MKWSVLASLAMVGVSLVVGATSVHAVPTAAAGYNRNYIGTVPGTTSAPNGGLAFLPSDPNTLLIGNPTPQTPANGTILAYGVTRDASNHITGFVGTSSFFANAPGLGNNGLAFGPGNVLFFSAGTSVGQIKAGSTSPDKVVDLSAISGFTFAGGGVVNEVNSPVGNPGKVNVIVHYPPTSANFYESTLTPDGSGTYDISSPTNVRFVGNTINYDPAPAAFPNLPDVFTTHGGSGMGSATLDADDRPTAFQGIDNTTAGAGVVDPLTGDYLFVHLGLEPGIHVISAVPEPTTAGLLALAAAVMTVRRGGRRRRSQR